MPGPERITVCGLYLGFPGISRCVSALKRLDVCARDMSILLDDGSVVSAEIVTRAKNCDSTGNTSSSKNEGIEHTSRLSMKAGAHTSLAGSLWSFGVPAYDSERLEERIKNGGILLLVRGGDSDVSEQIRAAMAESGAQEILVARRPGCEPESYRSAYSQSRRTELARAAGA